MGTRQFGDEGEVEKGAGSIEVVKRGLRGRGGAGKRGCWAGGGEKGAGKEVFGGGGEE